MFSCWFLTEHLCSVGLLAGGVMTEQVALKWAMVTLYSYFIKYILIKKDNISFGPCSTAKN